MSLRFTLQGSSGSRGGNNPGADTTCRGIKKMLPKGLSSHASSRRKKRVILQNEPNEPE